MKVNAKLTTPIWQYREYTQQMCKLVWFLWVGVIENAQKTLYGHIEKKFGFGKFVKKSWIREQNKTNKAKNILLWWNTFSTKPFGLEYI